MDSNTEACRSQGLELVLEKEWDFEDPEGLFEVDSSEADSSEVDSSEVSSDFHN